MPGAIDRSEFTVERESAELELLRAWVTKLSLTDYGGIEFANGEAPPRTKNPELVLDDDELNSVIDQLNEAIINNQAGMPLSLQGKSTEHFRTLVENLRLKLIKAGKLDQNKTL